MDAREQTLRAAVRAILITPGRGDLASALASASAALDAGVRCIQVREPHLSARELLRWGAALRELCSERDAMLLVNARVDVAAAPCFDGVHLSWRALSPRDARALLGAEKWIGVSAHALDEVGDLERLAACDYAIFGPVFHTPSKAGLLPACGIERLREAASAFARPLIAVGGLDETNAATLRGAGHAGCAAIRAFEEPSRASAVARAMFEALS
ncbi:MAG: thiamine phosphate synthase [Planctomycetes bacterium]|nr:thiamine phosphate synthase [Planctomycetota bacterium]